ncbi:MAG: thermostable hemolysin delta-VPH [Clostridia bacterium]|nr:thermostable hemolysin delta-VPH [Clostridia bacterium]
MMYFNYHAKVKRLIFEGRLVGYEFMEEYHGIKPALVLYFSDAKPMPIRDYMWEEYLPFLINFDDKNG